VPLLGIEYARWVIEEKVKAPGYENCAVVEEGLELSNTPFSSITTWA